jgi:transcription initiation factor IIF auxiliary subunit
MNRMLLRSCVAVALVSGVATPCLAQVAFTNTSTYRGSGRWDWKIAVQADRATLARIECVEYTLHSTFPDPTRPVCNAQATRFALESNGWGTFQVGIRVVYKDKHVESYTHQLVFSERKAAPTTTLTTENSSREREPGWWEWAVRIKGTASTLARVRCVEYTLHPSFPNPVRTICTPNNRFELKTNGWGTFSIPVKVIFKDNTTLTLTHQLHFGT